MSSIKKSFHYYFIICPFDRVDYSLFFDTALGDFIFDYAPPPSEYLVQGAGDILGDEQGIMFSQLVIQEDPSAFFKDYYSCFGFNLPVSSFDPDKIRFDKNYTFNFVLGSKDYLQVKTWLNALKPADSTL